MLSVGVILAVMVCAMFGADIAPHDAHYVNLQVGTVGPNSVYPLGTDSYGQDVLSRTIVGARTALIAPLVVAVGSALLATILGITAGYYGRWPEGIIMRWVDMMYAIPGVLFIVVVVGVLGNGSYTLAVALFTVLATPYGTRAIRAVTLEQRHLPYVEAAVTLGLAPRRVMFGHILPNVLSRTVAIAFLNFAGAIVGLASLSFLGFGAGPGAADWGRMISEGRNILFINPWSVVAPGLAIVLTAVAMNIVGDWLFERFEDRGRAR
jgi:peptide/nickel transport system permease protein